MKQFRRHSQRNRILILLIVMSLLWSQFAFALHGVHCAGVATAAAGVQGCSHQSDTSVPSESRSLCAKHCGEAQSDQTPGLAKLPALGAVLPEVILSVVASSIALSKMEAPTSTAAHHGPTGHPARILLI
mgnify:CR=1 FL=1|jgi:hypothetical protein